MVGIKAGRVRLPLVDATNEEIKFLEKLMNDHKKIKVSNTNKQAQAFSELKVASESVHPIV